MVAGGGVGLMTGEVMIVVCLGGEAQPTRNRSASAEMKAAATIRPLRFAVVPVCMLENGRLWRPYFREQRRCHASMSERR